MLIIDFFHCLIEDNTKKPGLLHLSVATLTILLKVLCKLVSNLSSSSSAPWLLMEDINEITNLDEKLSQSKRL